MRDLNLFGFKTYYDRNFDVRFRLWREGRYRPQVALGLQDFSGTGLFGAEYIVASKSFRTPAWGGAARDGGRLMVTGASAGGGWAPTTASARWAAARSIRRHQPRRRPSTTSGSAALRAVGGIEWRHDGWG